MMVKKMGAWMLLALLTLVGEWCGSYGCSEEERIGLLEIKALIDPNHLSLGDWVDSSNCCEWPGIECDNTTRRVIQLSLFGARDQSLGDWVLNASLFLPFKELQSLDLSSNGLVGCFENQGFEVQSSKLEVLDLSQNRFNNDKSILSCLCGLSSLKSLDLSDNGLKGSGFKDLSSRLKKVENLDLSWNQYNDSIFSSITGFSSLKSLDLSYNQLTGSTGINSFQLQPMRLGKLENLDLSDNELNSSILSILSGLSSLKSLHLSNNMLTGSGFKVLSSRLKNLENLYLSRNQWNDDIFSSLSGFSSLKYLDLSFNQLTGSTGINSFQLQPMRLGKLENLDLSDNQLNSSILSILSGLSSLKSLDLSNNMVTGSGTFFNSSTLEELYLDYTSLPLNFLQNIGALPALKVLSVGESNLNDTLPAHGTFFNSSTLEELYLDYTSLPLNFLQNIGALPALKVLSVGECNINGTLPAQVA